MEQVIIKNQPLYMSNRNTFYRPRNCLPEPSSNRTKHDLRQLNKTCCVNKEGYELPANTRLTRSDPYNPTLSSLQW